MLKLIIMLIHAHAHADSYLTLIQTLTLTPEIQKDADTVRANFVQLCYYLV